MRDDATKNKRASVTSAPSGESSPTSEPPVTYISPLPQATCNSLTGTTGDVCYNVYPGEGVHLAMTISNPPAASKVKSPAACLPPTPNPLTLPMSLLNQTVTPTFATISNDCSWTVNATYDHRWYGPQNDPSGNLILNESAIGPVVVLDQQTNGVTYFIQDIQATPIPTPAPTPTPQPTASPRVIVDTLILKGSGSSVTVHLIDPKDRIGLLSATLFEDPAVQPTPAQSPPPAVLLVGNEPPKPPGNYVIPFNCHALFGTYNEIYASWYIANLATFTGSLKHTFTVPSAALLSQLASDSTSLDKKSNSAAAANYLPTLFASFNKYGVTDPNIMAAMLAEVNLEDNYGSLNGGVEIIDENSAEQNYDGKYGNAPLPSTDGYTYRGRGLIQITGKANYQALDSTFGTKSVSDPDSILTNPQLLSDMAVRGMLDGSFTGVGIGQFVDGTPQGFYNARRSVNQLNQATFIQTISLLYQAAFSGSC